MLHHFIISKIGIDSFKGQRLKLSPDWYLFTETEKIQIHQQEDVKIIIVGDYIDEIETVFNKTDGEIVTSKGNFYLILVKNKSIKIFSSFLNILPIYYTTDLQYISSSIQYLKSYVPTDFEIDKKFILENLLFNYGFFNRTLYKGIHLLPSNSHLLLQNNNTTIQKHFETSSLFTKKPTKGKKVVNNLSDLFIKNTKQYFPDEKFDIAFTSGFDGRTLVSCATHFKKHFSTFSFGKHNNDDVAVPKINAEELQVPYDFFDLGATEYVDDFYYKNALEYIEKLPGANGFIYAHFLHSTKCIAKNTDYLMSGVIGSELFRALHLTGAVTSQSLADIFIAKSADEIREKLMNAQPLKSINTKEFSKELEELIDEIIDYKESLSNNQLTVNQQFYIFVFEEIFRKFFGQWIYLQMQYVNVRTPFLDFQFIKELLKTQYAGANNDFFTENPLKRKKGQYIYADIIKKTNNTIYKQKTGKGYRPKDVREPLFLMNIIFPFIKKRLRRKIAQVNLDNLGIISGALKQKNFFYEVIEKNTWLDQDYIKKILDDLSPYTKEKERDLLLSSLSIGYILYKEYQTILKPTITNE